jgi:SAM-dependent methyltransferase
MNAAMSGRIQQHNERPAAVWSAGGKDYDEISRGIADSIEHCVLRLNPQPGERILDLSTGTGWTSRLVARRGAIVAGVDIADDLLDAARANAAAEQLRIDYQLGDAEDLPFQDGAFDAVVSTVGIMFASRPDAAAAELARVCRRGGRIALTSWTSDSSVRKMFEVMRRYMPPPPSPPPPSPFEWGRTERIQELLGSFQLRFEKGCPLPYRARAAWDTFSKGYGPRAGREPRPGRAALRGDFVAFHEGPHGARQTRVCGLPWLTWVACDELMTTALAHHRSFRNARCRPDPAA